MKRLPTISAGLAGLVLAACAGVDYSPRETAGGLTGAVIGGYLGSQVGEGEGKTLATGAGALLGAMIGSEIGRALDDVDRLRAREALTRAHSVPIGETVRWNNPDSGHFGTVTPVRDGTSTAGRYCREYRQSITVDGRREVATGIACRRSDGTWQIVS